MEKNTYQILISKKYAKTLINHTDNHLLKTYTIQTITLLNENKHVYAQILK